jgi:hypothetical protein
MVSEVAIGRLVEVTTNFAVAADNAFGALGRMGEQVSSRGTVAGRVATVNRSLNEAADVLRGAYTISGLPQHTYEGLGQALGKVNDAKGGVGGVREIAYHHSPPGQWHGKSPAPNRFLYYAPGGGRAAGPLADARAMVDDLLAHVHDTVE